MPFELNHFKCCCEMFLYRERFAGPLQHYIYFPCIELVWLICLFLLQDTGEMVAIKKFKDSEGKNNRNIHKFISEYISSHAIAIFNKFLLVEAGIVIECFLKLSWLLNESYTNIVENG